MRTSELFVLPALATVEEVSVAVGEMLSLEIRAVSSAVAVEIAQLNPAALPL